MDTIRILEADLDDENHTSAILKLVNMYSLDNMGASKPLSRFVLDNLISGLKSIPTTLVFLAFLDKQPVGIAVCFKGFSTFMAKPLINIHDLAVDPGFRGLGIGRRLLQAVEDKAVALGCGKLTLEVLENNHRAKEAYRAFGFNRGQAAEEAERYFFYAKILG